MFTLVESPTNHFTLLPLPSIFFENPPPFGAGALLLLNRFNNNSATLLPAHLQGIAIAAAQAKSSMNSAFASCEVYGFTDRSGSESVNKVMSNQRASAALGAMKAAAGLDGVNFSNGLGERFADEYFQVDEDARNDVFRGVAVYLWESFNTATDPFLKVNVAFASPSSGIEGRDRIFLAALHMGRHRAQPASPFR